MDDLIFIKLGGSLITNKAQTRSAREEVISRLSLEIKQSFDHLPRLRMIIGHGSGSFGHHSAKQFNTIEGVHSATQWRGFSEVWRDAHNLNTLVLSSLQNVGIPVLSFSPSSWMITSNRKVIKDFTGPIKSCLDAGLVPLIHGDVVWDEFLGGTILSTEDVFFHLASIFHPTRILLVGEEPGIWQNFPHRNKIIPLITPKNFEEIVPSLAGSAATDVTGGMYQKVLTMLELLKITKNTEISIFSGLEPGLLYSAIYKERPGTTIRNY